MDITEIIRNRRSVRTFDGKMISEVDKEKILSYIETIRNPYDIPVEFILLDAEEKGLSSPVLKGETMYVTAKVAKVPHNEEAFGYSFEQLVLYAWSLGLGTTWIGGTMDRAKFEKAAELKEGERMSCVSPLGYPAERMSIKEGLMRKGVNADVRMPASKLFFEGSFGTPLVESDETAAKALEAVRRAPSAVNKQPWRIVKDGSSYHFYIKHDKGYVSEAVGDMQKIDMGIALCHFMSVAGGSFKLQDPGIAVPEGVEYIATVEL